MKGEQKEMRKVVTSLEERVKERGGKCANGLFPDLLTVGRCPVLSCQSPMNECNVVAGDQSFCRKGHHRFCRARGSWSPETS